jgi:hypothetical protein
MAIDAEDDPRGVEVKSRLTIENWLRQVIVVVPNKVATLSRAYGQDASFSDGELGHVGAGLQIDGHQPKMLVPSVEFVEREQNIIAARIVVASRVRLAVSDEFNSLRGHLFCFLRKLTFERVFRAPEWEGGLSVRFPALQDSKLLCQVIQRGAKVKQRFSDAEADSIGQPLPELVSPHINSLFIFSLGDKLVPTILDKFGDLGFDLLDFGFGLFDLGLNVEKRFRFH